MLPENITSIAYGAFGGTLEYGRIESYCKKVKIKRGAQFNRLKALVIASEYPESMIVSY